MKAKQALNKALIIALAAATVTGTSAAGMVFPNGLGGISVNAATVNEKEKNDSMETANSISFGDTVNGTITDTDTKDFYKIVAPSSGKITISLTAYLSDLRFWIYDSDGNAIFDKGGSYFWEHFQWNATAEMMSETVEIDVTSGTYYICFGKHYDVTGNYNFKTSFKSANESFKETGNGTNNTMATSNIIDLEKSYNGQIAANDEKDFYKVTIPSSGYLKIDLTAYLSELRFWVYDSNGEVLFDKGGGYSWEHFQWNATAEKMSETVELNLTAGTYYICFGKQDKATGNYNFKTSFKSANESFKETGNGNDNTMATSNTISLGKTYYGQIANNDDKDFYKFNISSSDKLTISLTADMSDLRFWVYDSNGKILFNKGGDYSWEHFCWDSTTKKIKETVELDVAKGTYYVCFGRHNIGGNYQFLVSTPNTKNIVDVTSVSLNKTDIWLGKGETFKLNATVKPNNATDKTVTWTSSNSNVCSVDSNGNLTGKSNGTATITAKTSSGKTATCKVTVKQPATQITVEETTATLKPGQTLKLTTHVPGNSASNTRTYTTSNSNVCTVSYNGTITAKNPGTATVTVKTFNGKTATCYVTVPDPNGVAATSVSLNKTSLILGKDESYTVKATVSPSNANKTVTWSTSNSNVATVSGGKITAKNKGTATITVKTSNGKTATCKVTVNNAPTNITLEKTKIALGVGESYKLLTHVSNGSASNARNWTTSDSSVCTVSYNGTITGKKPGKATVTVKTYNGKTATCQVTIGSAPSNITLERPTIWVGVGESFKLLTHVSNGSASNARNWTTSDSSVCTVSYNGTITGKKPGTATVTVKTYNGKTATCQVTVKQPATAITLDTYNVTLSKGQNFKLYTHVPGNSASATRMYSSSNPSVCTVSANGVLTAKKEGTATITVYTFNGKRTTCKVTVKQLRF